MSADAQKAIHYTMAARLEQAGIGNADLAATLALNVIRAEVKAASIDSRSALDFLNLILEPGE